MAISAGTTTQIAFLRRFSGNLEPPMATFPVSDTTTAFRFGQPLVIDATNGKVKLASGAAATGIPLASLNTGMVGIVGGANISSFTAPTAAGAHAGGIAFTSPASVTTNDPIPENEKVTVILALEDCVFRGHMTNGATDITAPTRAFVAATGGLFQRMGIWVGTPTGETLRGMLDTTTVTTNTLTCPIEWAYPQPVPQTRSSSSAADPFRFAGGSGGTANPAVEFTVIGTWWNPTA